MQSKKCSLHLMNFVCGTSKSCLHCSAKLISRSSQDVSSCSLLNLTEIVQENLSLRDVLLLITPGSTVSVTVAVRANKQNIKVSSGVPVHMCCQLHSNQTHRLFDFYKHVRARSAALCRHQLTRSEAIYVF